MNPPVDLSDVLRSWDDSMRAMVVSWANINSGSHHEAGLWRMLEQLEADFAGLGESMERVELPQVSVKGADGSTVALPQVPALRVTCRPEAPVQVLLNGHFDTVYGEDSPFQTCREFAPDDELARPGRINGPGVADMKGGIVILLHALRAFEQTEGKDKLGWEVLLTPDEEIGSPRSKDHFGEIADRFDVGLIVEPPLPDGSLVRSRKGSGVFTLTVRGVAAHTGRDFAAGRSAIAAISRFIDRFEHLNTILPGANFNTGNVRGGGPTNQVPDLAVAQFQIRLAETEQAAQIDQLLDQLVARTNAEAGIEATLEGGWGRPPKPCTPEVEALYAVAQDAAKELGFELGWADTGGGSDGNNLAAAGLPNIDTFGIRGNFLHTEREFADLDSLVERSCLLGSVLQRLARDGAPRPPST